MNTRPPVWMLVLLGVQLAIAVAGLVYVTGLASALSQHDVAIAHDDVPLFYPLIAVLVLGIPALLLWKRDRPALSTILAIAPFPVAIALMVWAWW